MTGLHQQRVTFAQQRMIGNTVKGHRSANDDLMADRIFAHLRQLRQTGNINQPQRAGLQTPLHNYIGTAGDSRHALLRQQG
ncbi:hypothetical protein A3N45_02350 [Klebsiella aerogenes]|nr:hypothetical protein A3N45_02350 [Klebsiella aerogenes]